MSIFTRLRRLDRPARRSARLRLEPLEGRAVPATFAVTNANDAGAGTLRQAVLDANGFAGDDTIVFANSVRNIALTGGEIAVTESVAIQGTGANRLTVSGRNASRVFVTQGGAVRLSGMTLTRGFAGEGSSHYESAGGAVLNLGNLIVSNVTFTNNRAVGDADVVVPINPVFNLAGGAVGGAVANFGSLVVSDCRFSDNAALGADEADAPATPDNLLDPAFAGTAAGGAITNYGLAVVSNSRFTDNVAVAGDRGTGDFAAIGSGGAIYNDGALTVTGGSFRHNRAEGGDHSVSPMHNGHALGGAIASGSLAVVLGTPGAGLTVIGTTFEDNVSAGGDGNETAVPQPAPVDGPNNGVGGAIAVYQGTAALTSCAIDGNRAVGGAGGAGANGSLGVGGGVFFLSFIGPVSATVTNCTVTNNEAVGGWGGLVGDGGDGLGGGLAFGGLGGLFSGGVTATVTGTTVRGNTARGGLAGLIGDGGDGLGGGVYNDADSALTVTASSIRRNHALGGSRLLWGRSGDGIGGGVYNLGTFAPTATIITNNFASTSDDDVYTV